jgi:hypothetical protein
MILAKDACSYSMLSDEEMENIEEIPVVYSMKSKSDLMKWHQCLGYLNIATIRDLVQKYSTRIEYDDILSNEAAADCLACIEGKQHKQPSKIGCTHATHIGELIHMDLAGPMETTSFDQKCYFLIMINDFSHEVWTNILTSKLEVLPKVCDYIAQLEMRCGGKVQGVMGDNSIEFINTEFSHFLQSKGIMMYMSVLYMPEQNGVAEWGI